MEQILIMKDKYKNTPLIWLCKNSSVTLEKKLDIIKFIKKYITDIDKEIEKIKIRRYVKGKEEIIEELESVESTTKSAAKR
jgi:predicted nucleotide-binding protein (sugar kinase/HSP70/actin superfamily)